MQRRRGRAEPDPAGTAEGDGHAVVVHLDELLAARGMTLTQLSDEVGVTLVNLSVLKNQRARAVRFSTLTRLCQALDCQPGDILSVPRPVGQPRDQTTHRAG